MNAQQERQVEKAALSVLHTEQRLEKLRNGVKAQSRPSKIHRDDNPQDFDLLVREAENDVAKAKSHLALAKNPPKPVDPIEKIKDTQRSLDKYEKRNGTDEQTENLRDSLDRRLAMLEGRPLPPKPRGMPLMQALPQSDRISELEGRLANLENR